MPESKQIKATAHHVELMRDLALVISRFQKYHPEMDVVESISVLGSVAGACLSSAPDEPERARARQSVINSMDSALADFLAERIKRSNA